MNGNTGDDTGTDTDANADASTDVDTFASLSEEMESEILSVGVATSDEEFSDTIEEEFSGKLFMPVIEIH